jgi:gamma-glutamylcyclotransferase (GGCT)/AIG2-like uncharacterized protein YtfP
MLETKIKLGVYGSYKKGFHNHGMLGDTAEFKGLAKITGVMYLVDGKEPYPLLYTDSGLKTMEKLYIVELYEIDQSEYEKILAKETKEDGKLIRITTNDEEYKIFVTNKEKKPLPGIEDRIDAFEKREYNAHIFGTLTLYALDQEKAETQFDEIIENAVRSFDVDEHEEAALILGQLEKEVREVIQPDGQKSPIQPENIPTS